jgi:hypothetical protein
MEKKMSEDKSINADELIKAKKPTDIQLNEEELSKASAGSVSFAFNKVKVSYNPEDGE